MSYPIKSFTNLKHFYRGLFDGPV